MQIRIDLISCFIIVGLLVMALSFARDASEVREQAVSRGYAKFYQDGSAKQFRWVEPPSSFTVQLIGEMASGTR